MSNSIHPLEKRLKDVVDTYLKQEGVFSRTKVLDGRTRLFITDSRYGASLETKADAVANRDIRLSLTLIPRATLEEYNCINRFLQRLIRDDGMTIFYDDSTTAVAAASKFNAIRSMRDSEQMAQEVKDVLDELHEWKFKRYLTILEEFKKCRG